MGILNFLFGTPKFDDREDFLADEHGNPLAIRIEGEFPDDDISAAADIVNHEDFSHDGTPHQNPAVRLETRGWLFPRRVQVNYYPLTVADDGRHADIEEMQDRIDDLRTRSGQRVEIAPMNRRVTKQAVRVEDAGQRARGVQKLRKPGRRSLISRILW